MRPDLQEEGLVDQETDSSGFHKHSTALHVAQSHAHPRHLLPRPARHGRWRQRLRARARPTELLGRCVKRLGRTTKVQERKSTREEPSAGLHRRALRVLVGFLLRSTASHDCGATLRQTRVPRRQGWFLLSEAGRLVEDGVARQLLSLLFAVASSHPDLFRTPCRGEQSAGGSLGLPPVER
jgi:hypothetical protein